MSKALSQFSTNSLDQNSNNTQMRNTPTIDVVRNTSSLSLANIAWANFIAGPKVTIDANSLQVGQRIRFVNTSLNASASIALSNGVNVGVIRNLEVTANRASASERTSPPAPI